MIRGYSPCRWVLSYSITGQRGPTSCYLHDLLVTRARRQLLLGGQIPPRHYLLFTLYLEVLPYMLDQLHTIRLYRLRWIETISMGGLVIWGGLLFSVRIIAPMIPLPNHGSGIVVMSSAHGRSCLM